MTPTVTISAAPTRSRSKTVRARPRNPLLAPVWTSFFESPDAAASPRKCAEFDALIRQHANQFAGELFLETPLFVIQRWPEVIRVETTRCRADSPILTTEVEHGYPELDQYEEHILCTIQTNPLAPLDFTARCSVSVEEDGFLWKGFLRLVKNASPQIKEVFHGIEAGCSDSGGEFLVRGDIDLAAVMSRKNPPQQVEIYINYGANCEKERHFDMFTRQCAYYKALVFETQKKGSGVASLNNYLVLRPRRRYKTVPVKPSKPQWVY